MGSSAGVELCRGTLEKSAFVAVRCIEVAVLDGIVIGPMVTWKALSMTATDPLS
jgi:hypothetical protein